jgi:hypothetical protein
MKQPDGELGTAFADNPPPSGAASARYFASVTDYMARLMRRRDDCRRRFAGRVYGSRALRSVSRAPISLLVDQAGGPARRV